MPLSGGGRRLRNFKVLKVLERYSDIIRSFRIAKFEQVGTSLRLRVEVEFIDGSKLYIRETVIEGAKRKAIWSMR